MATDDDCTCVHDECDPECPVCTPDGPPPQPEEYRYKNWAGGPRSNASITYVPMTGD